MASPSNKRTWAFGLELQHAVHLPGTKTKKPLQIQHKVRQGGRLIREQEQEGTLLKEELRGIQDTMPDLMHNWAAQKPDFNNALLLER